MPFLYEGGLDSVLFFLFWKNKYLLRRPLCCLNSCDKRMDFEVVTSRSELTWLFDVFVLLLFSLEIMGRLPPIGASHNDEQGWLRQSKAQSMGKNVSRSSIFLRHGLIFA